MSSAAPKHIGRYEIQSRLGIGGMGQVYAAWDPRLSRSVAVKVMLPQHVEKPVSRQRFATEARTLAAITNPHVVRIYDFDADANPPWIVMEQVHGRTLRKVVVKDGRPSTNRLHDWAQQVLSGLAAVHQGGIIHRDVKPSNIILTEQGTCVLLDFGLAELERETTDLTNPGEIIGTIRYMTPARLGGEAATPHADCYALGVSLYELATADRLHGNLSPLATLQAVVGKGVPNLADERPDLSPEWLAWHARLCATDPAHGFANAMEALNALRQLSGPSGYDGDETVVGERTIANGTDTMATMVDKPTAPTVRSVGSTMSVSGTRRPVVAPTEPVTEVTAVTRPRPRGRFRFVVKLVLALWVLSTASALVSGYLISRAAIDRQTEQIRATITSAALAAAQAVDGDLHAELAGMGAKAAEHPAFAEINKQLQAFKQAWPKITYIYTMRQLPDSEAVKVVAFVVDASPEIDKNNNGVIDPDEENAAPGDRYSFADLPALFQGFEKPTADAEASSDQWGTWISGYAPIRESNGASAGLVGVDLSVSVVDALRRDFYMQALVLIGSSLIAFIAAGWLVAWRLRRPVQILRKGMTALAGGDLHTPVYLNTGDEFDELADAYEILRHRLTAAAALRQGYESFAARALGDRAEQSISAAPRIQAWMTVRLQLGESTARNLSDAMETSLERMFGRIHDHGGLVAEVGADQVLLRFPSIHSSDVPQDRALRCALLLLSADQQWPRPDAIAVGVDATNDTSLPAVRVLREFLNYGVDLVATPEAFQSVERTFIADAIERDGQLLFFAIKSAATE